MLEAGGEATAIAREAGIHRLSIPTPFAVGRVNCYLIEDEPLTLVDTGPNSGKALDELERQLADRGHRIEDLELVIITHQHIDHLGLIEIVANRSGAEVAAIDLAVERLRNFGQDAERDDEFAGELMRRYGIPDDVVTALRTVSRSFRGWGAHAEVTRPLRDGESLGPARPLAGGPAPPRAQPLGHRLLGLRSRDPDRGRPPDRPHLVEPAPQPPTRRFGRAAAGAGRVHQVAPPDPRAAGQARPPRATATRSPTTGR